MAATSGTAASSGQGRSAGSWAVLATLIGLSVVGAVGLVDVEWFDAQVVGPTWMAIAAAVWLVFGAVMVWAVVALQRYAHRSWSLILLALAWGGLAAVWLAGRAHQAIDSIITHEGGDPAWTVWGVSPPLEESLKALGIALVILVPVLRRSSTLDGAFVGALVGAGFQVVEDLAFSIPAMETAADERGTALASIVLLRGVIGVFSHVVFSAIVGAAIGWFIGLRRRRTAGDVLVVAGAFAVAMLLHGVTNWAATEGQIPVYLAVSLLGLVILVVVLRRARRHEDYRLTDWAEGPGRGVVSSAVVEALHRTVGRGSRRERRRALRTVARAEFATLAPPSA